MKDFRIVTYLAGWNGEKGMEKLRYDCLDQINYAFAIPTEEGDVLPFPDPDFVHKVVNEAHAHNVQVMISVGGWSWQDVPLEATFEKATETPEKTARLAKAIVDVVDEYDFDGADIDWEYPRVHSAKANEALYELPETGRGGIYKNSMISVLIMCISLTGVLYLRKYTGIKS